MKCKVTAVVALIVGLAATAQAAQLQGDVAAGEQKSASCVGCHGADGNSMAPGFPKLAGLGTKYLYKQLQDIRDGVRPVPTMAGQVDNMSDQDLADIAAYFDAQTRTRSVADPDQLALGRKIYLGGIQESSRNVAACAGCHSPSGKGNSPAGFPGLAGQHAEYIATQLKMFRKGYDDPTGRVNDGDSKIMRKTAFPLSDKEIEAVSSYVAGLK